MKLLLFLYGWVLYYTVFMATLLASEAFWVNFKDNITAVGTVLILLGTTYVGFQANKAKKNSEEATKIAEKSKVVIDELHKTTNSKMDALLKAKDDLAKGKEDAKLLEEIKESAYNKGKLETIEKLKVEDALRNTPPSTSNPPLTKEAAPEIIQVVKEQTVDKQIIKEEPPKK